MLVGERTRASERERESEREGRAGIAGNIRDDARSRLFPAMRDPKRGRNENLHAERGLHGGRGAAVGFYFLRDPPRARSTIIRAEI